MTHTFFALGPDRKRAAQGSSLTLKLAAWTTRERRRVAFHVTLALSLSMPLGASAATVPDCPSAIDVSEALRAGDYAQLDRPIPACVGPVDAAILRAMRAAARLDTAAALAEIGRYRDSGDVDPSRLLLAAEIEADAAFLAGDYRRAATAATEQARLNALRGLDDRARSAAQTAALAGPLARAPRQRKLGGRALPTRTDTDAAGLTRVAVGAGSRSEAMVLDTGANLSVLSASTARRLGARLLAGAAAVGSSTKAAVATRVAIVPRLTIGGVIFANVVFLVLDDAQLNFPGGYRIDGIVGLPVFRQAGGMWLSRRGMLMLVPPRSDAAASTALWASGSTLVVAAKVTNRPVSLHLDTGANRTVFNARFAQRYPALARSEATRKVRRGGAGGTEDRTVSILPRVELQLGQWATTLADVELDRDVATAKDARLGVLGQDVLARADWWGLDFRTMGFLIAADTRPPG